MVLFGNHGCCVVVEYANVPGRSFRGCNGQFIVLVVIDVAECDGFAGASAGCASVTGALAQMALAMPELGAAGWLRKLGEGADYLGPEQRGARVP